jgi:uncharacterized membrane protein (UPF0127 family)
MAAGPIKAGGTRTGLALISTLIVATGAAGVLWACDASHAKQGDKPSEPAPRTPPREEEKPGNGADGATGGGSTKDTTSEGAREKVAYETVTIAGRRFKLELAADEASRFRGLSGRTEIPEDGGMLFVFPRAGKQSFVMRDCPVPIDIIYLDGAGRVVSFYKMTPEPPRGDDEKEPDPGRTYNSKYENRLKRYPSRFDAQFVIELKGNTLDALSIKPGEKVEIDVVRLKRLAK